MVSKPINYPKLGKIINPDITEEENKANTKKIQDILVLIGIHYLKSRRGTEGGVDDETE